MVLAFPETSRTFIEEWADRQQQVVRHRHLGVFARSSGLGSRLIYDNRVKDAQALYGPGTLG